MQLAFDTYNQQPQHLLHTSFDSEDNSFESNPSGTMEGYYPDTASNNYYHFDFANVDLQTSTLDGYTDNYTQEMARSDSHISMKRPGLPTLYSSGSIASAPSSTVSSPYSGHAHMVPVQDNYALFSQNFYAAGPQIVTDDSYQQEHVPVNDQSFQEQDHKFMTYAAEVDPNMLMSSRDSMYLSQYGNATGYSQLPNTVYPFSSAPSPSPAPSHYSCGAISHHTADSRLQRGTSVSSRMSAPSPRTSVSGDEDGVEKGRCSHPECGKIFKDLKAHMLTHLSERPEKCPIPTCDYHTKGFSRKYDKNRHTLTHYKGTMICGFCPGSGSSAEKSFNRADVFKRHLHQVHKVAQNPPNSRKRSPTNSGKKLSSYCQDATGKCSTCSKSFNNAQEFYDHLDDCVLAVVQKLDKSEDINAARLAEVSNDAALQATFDRFGIKQEETPQPCNDEEEDEEEEDDDEDEDDEMDGTHDRSGRLGSRSVKSRAVISGHISKTKSGKKNGMTWSKMGVPLAGKGRKRRKNYPPSWGMSADKMKMKKRVLCVYDGSRRLLKDDMMLDNEFEVRVKLADGNSYVTDLDIESLKRAEAYNEATIEEKGMWDPETEEVRPWMPEQELFHDFN